MRACGRTVMWAKLAAMFTLTGLMGLGQAGEPPTAPVASTQASTKPAVEMLAIDLTRNADNEVLRLAKEQFNYNESPGVKLALAVDYPGGDILDIGGVVIDSFTDDKGTDLGNGQPARRSGGPEEKPYAIAPGGHSLVLRLASNKTPVDGAMSIKIKGSVTLKAGIGAKELKAVTLPLRAGRVLETPEGKLTLTSLSETRDRTTEGMQLIFKASGGMEGIKTLRMTAENGTALPVKVTVGHDGPDTIVTVQLAKMASTAVVTPVLYTEVKTVQVPLDLSVGLGSAGGRP